MRWKRRSQGSSRRKSSSISVGSDVDIVMTDISPRARATRASMEYLSTGSRDSLISAEAMRRLSWSTYAQGSGQQQPPRSAPPLPTQRPDWGFRDGGGGDAFPIRRRSTQGALANIRKRPAKRRPSVVGVVGIKPDGNRVESAASPDHHAESSDDSAYIQFPLSFDTRGTLIPPPTKSATQNPQVRRSAAGSVSDPVQGRKGAGDQSTTGTNECINWSLSPGTSPEHITTVTINQAALLSTPPAPSRVTVSTPTAGRSSGHTVTVGMPARETLDDRDARSTATPDDRVYLRPQSNNSEKSPTPRPISNESIYDEISDSTGSKGAKGTPVLMKAEPFVTVDTVCPVTGAVTKGARVGSIALCKLPRSDVVRMLVRNAPCAGTFLFRESRGKVVLSLWDGYSVQHFGVSDHTRPLTAGEFKGGHWRKFFRRYQAPGVLPVALRCAIVGD